MLCTTAINTSYTIRTPAVDLGVTRVTSHPPPLRDSLFHVIIMRVT